MRRVLEERAREAGFDLLGVTSAEPLREGGERLASGRRRGRPPTWATCTGPWSY